MGGKLMTESEMRERQAAARPGVVWLLKGKDYSLPSEPVVYKQVTIKEVGMESVTYTREDGRKASTVRARFFQRSRSRPLAAQEPPQAPKPLQAPPALLSRLDALEAKVDRLLALWS